MANIFDIALTGLVAIFVLGILWIISANLIGEHIYPLMKSLNVSEDKGITNSQYHSLLDTLNSRSLWPIYILIGAVFVYILVRLFYKREHISAYVDYGG